MKTVINEGAVILVTKQTDGQVNIIVLYSYIVLQSEQVPSDRKKKY